LGIYLSLYIDGSVITSIIKQPQMVISFWAV